MRALREYANNRSAECECSVRGELEKKKQRQKVAVAATEAELPRIQAEIAELEEELDGHQRAQISPS